MYAVVAYYSFDTAMPIILFDTEEQAKEYLQQMFQSEVQTDIESGKQPVTSHADDGWWAQIENDWTDAHGDMHEDITLWQITDDISDHRRNPRIEVKTPAGKLLATGTGLNGPHPGVEISVIPEKGSEEDKSEGCLLTSTEYDAEDGFIYSSIYRYDVKEPLIQHKHIEIQKGENTDDDP